MLLHVQNVTIKYYLKKCWCKHKIWSCDTGNKNVKSYINTFQWGINILCPDNKPPFNQEGYSCSIMTAIHPLHLKWERIFHNLLEKEFFSERVITWPLLHLFSQISLNKRSFLKKALISFQYLLASLNEQNLKKKHP